MWLWKPIHCIGHSCRPDRRAIDAAVGTSDAKAYLDKLADIDSRPIAPFSRRYGNHRTRPSTGEGMAYQVFWPIQCHMVSHPQ